MKESLLKTAGVLLMCFFFTGVYAQKEKVTVYFLEDVFCQGANVSSVSPNGKYVVGHSLDWSNTAFIWNLETRKVEPITGSKDTLASAYKVTDEGLVAGAFMDSTKFTYDGRKGCPVPGYWKEGVWTALPLKKGVTLVGSWLDGFGCSVSGDGKTITGTIQFSFGHYTPAVWKDGVLQDRTFEEVDLGQGGYCYGASDDSNVAVGWAEHENGSRSPAAWTDGKLKRILGETEDEEYFFDGQAVEISPDGNYAAGYFSLQGTGFDAYPFVWSKETGAVKYAESGIASAVTDKGHVYGATAYMGDGTIYKDGIQYVLSDYLRENYDFDPGVLKYSLGTVMAVSADEKIIGGWTIGDMIGGMPLMMPYIVVIEETSAIESGHVSGFDVRLSPNPVNDRLFIDGEFETACVYNFLGATVISDVQTHSVDVSNLGRGVYFVKVSDGVSGKTFKIVKD